MKIKYFNNHNVMNGKLQEGHDNHRTPITPNSKPHPMHGRVAFALGHYTKNKGTKVLK